MIPEIVCFLIFLVHTATARILLYKLKLCSMTTLRMLLVGVGYGLITFFFAFLIAVFVLPFRSQGGATILLVFFPIGAAYCCSVTDDKKAREIIGGSYILSMVLSAFLFNILPR